MSNPFLSICIRVYIRPGDLCNLLASIDCNPAVIKVGICDDLAPEREDVRLLKLVRKFPTFIEG